MLKKIFTMLNTVEDVQHVNHKKIILSMIFFMI